MSNQKLKVWWVPQIPGKAFEVPVSSVEEGVKIMDTLAQYDAFQYENRIKPDYCNAGGLMMFDPEDDTDGPDGSWWYDDDTMEDDLAELEAEGIPHEKGPAMLSDEELAAMQRLCVGHNWPIKFARAVERAVIERCAEVLAQISNDRSGPYWAGANRCIAAIRAMLEEKP